MAQISIRPKEIPIPKKQYKDDDAITENIKETLKVFNRKNAEQEYMVIIDEY
jgi:osmotically-inducible protein OsmY